MINVVLEGSITRLEDFRNGLGLDVGLIAALLQGGPKEIRD